MVGSLFPTGNLAAYSKEAFESFGKDGVNSRAN